jgi:hypothetical protein
VYLFFDAYKTSATIKEISITEERVLDITGRAVTGETLSRSPYPNENLRNADTPLAQQYVLELQKVPFTITHTVQTVKEGVIRFYIQPRDSFGIGYSYADAQSRGLYVEALLDLPPDPVTGIGGTYNRLGGIITLSWTDPANVDLDHVDISWTGGAKTVKAGEQKAVLAGMTSGLYNFTITAVDRGGNRNAVVFPFNADSTIPIPVSNLQGSYNRSSQSMVLSWDNPADPEAETIKISWTGTAGGSATIGLSGTSQDYAIPGIAPANGAAYTVTVKTANALKESNGASVIVYPDITPPSPVPVTALYTQSSRTIAVRWTDPADADLQEILLEWGITGVAIAGTARVSRGQQSYVITKVVSDSRGYMVRAYAVDRAGNKSAVTSVTVETEITPSGGSVTVHGPGEKISLSPETPVSLSFKNNGSRTFTVSGYDTASSIRWLVDGNPVAGTNGRTTFTVSAQNYFVRAYTLTVMAESGGRVYSQDLVFTITE